MDDKEYIELLKKEIEDIKLAYDWWNEDPTDRCQSVVWEAIDSAVGWARYKLPISD